MKKVLIAALLVALPGVALAEYKFKLVNTSDVKVTGVEASEDGKTWGTFDVGAGIEPGATYDMTWDSSTDDSGCEWQVKATYADGSESEPATFDFCEEDLVIELQ